MVPQRHRSRCGIHRPRSTVAPACLRVRWLLRAIVSFRLVAAAGKSGTSSGVKQEWALALVLAVARVSEDASVDMDPPNNDSQSGPHSCFARIAQVCPDRKQWKMNRRTNLKRAESRSPAAWNAEARVLRLTGLLLLVGREIVPANRDEVDLLGSHSYTCCRISACFPNSFSMGSVHSSGRARCVSTPFNSGKPGAQESQQCPGSHHHHIHRRCCGSEGLACHRAIGRRVRGLRRTVPPSLHSFIWLPLAHHHQDAFQTGDLKLHGTFEVNFSRFLQFFTHFLRPIKLCSRLLFARLQSSEFLQLTKCFPDHTCFEALIYRISLRKHLRDFLKPGGRSLRPGSLWFLPVTEVQPWQEQFQPHGRALDTGRSTH